MRVAGRVSRDDLAEELAELEGPSTVAHEDCTVLSGSFPDQAALHGFLHALRARRLQVVRVRRTAR